MVKYSRILVAVDGSEASLNALKESFRFSNDSITVVSVAPPYEGDLRVVGEDLQALLREPCDQALGKAAALAEAEGMAIKTVCVMGEPHESIVELAETENCDLIVMGPQGQNGLARVLIGSTTRRVIGYSPLDVLVVPPHSRLGWEKIMVPTDGSAYSQKAAARALDLAQEYGSEITVLSVLDLRSQRLLSVGKELTAREQEYIQEVTSMAVAQGTKAEGLVQQGRVDQVITDLARERNVNLIVMGSHGRTGLTRLLMGSVTEKVICYAPCPVLVVKQ